MKQNDNHNKTTFGKKHGGQQLKWPGNKREVKTIEIRLIEEGKEKFLLSVGVFALNMRRAYEDNRVQKWHGSDKIVYVKRKRANCLLAFLFIGVPTCQNNTHGQDLFFILLSFGKRRVISSMLSLILTLIAKQIAKSTYSSFAIIFNRSPLHVLNCN